jgi:adhesin/invasin
VDAAGYVYIADTFNSRIRKVSPDGVITTIAGQGRAGYSGDGGPATSARLYFPHGVAVDSAGNVYISDEGNSTIRMLQAAAPLISANGVVNAASYAPQISAGSLATVFAANITGVKASATAPLPTSLAGVSVSVNGVKAPLLYVTPTQVNFQVPWKTNLGPASVTIAVNGVVSNAVTVPVVEAAPGLFFYGSGRAVVQNSDYTLNSPSNPAKLGGTIIAYLTGSGPVNPPVADGALTPTSPFVKVTSPYSAKIGSTSAEVSFAGLAPGFVGVLQVNIVVPSGLPKGDYPLTVTIAGQDSNSAIVSVTP